MSRARQLTKGVALYGAGDVAIQAINFLLLPVYVQYLTRVDYGVLALLAGIEAPAKLFFRWGVDGAFMRFWYDAEDERDRQRLGSTVFYFLLGVNGLLLALVLLLARPLAEHLLGGTQYTRALQLVFLNTFAIGFTFMPFHVLRMENRAGLYSLLAFGRSLLTLVLRLLLVVGFGYGVMGIVVTDVAVTAALLVATVPWFKRLVRPVFSRTVLRSALGFGLPRVPHGFALQVMSVADRFILERFRSVAEVGLYSMGVSVGLIPKIALAAFETAWAPFYYAVAKQDDARQVFARVTTYGIAALAVMAAALSASARDLLDVMTRGQFVDASPVVAWTALGVFFYGAYLLTSIGLNITSHTRYYPVSTLVGAGVNVSMNLALIPRYGFRGAAWAAAAAYAVQMLLAYRFSQRFYPIRYEWGRIAIAAAAPAAGYAAAVVLPDPGALAGAFIRAGVVVLVTGFVLWIAGFFTADERRWLRQIAGRRRPDAPPVQPAETTEMAGEIVAVHVPDGATQPPPERQ